MCLPSSRGSGNSSARCSCRGRSPCSSTVSEDPCVILRPPPDAPLYRSHPQRAPLPASVTISVLVNLTADGISRRVCRPAAGPQLYRADAHYPEGLIRHLDPQLAWMEAIAALEHALQASREIAAQGTANMEDRETRRKIIRQWMALPKDKRQTVDQAAAFAKSAVEQNKLQRSSRAPYGRIMGWLLPRVGRS